MNVFYETLVLSNVIYFFIVSNPIQTKLLNLGENGGDSQSFDMLHLGLHHTNVKRHADQNQSSDETEHVSPETLTADKTQPLSDNVTAIISPMVHSFNLNDSHLSIVVNWAGKNTGVLFCLALDNVNVVNGTFNLYRSSDYGRTFSDITHHIVLLDGVTKGFIDKFYHHPSSHCRYVFSDTVNNYVYTTVDCGQNFNPYQLSFRPANVIFDRLRDDIFMLHTADYALYLTSNFGETFKLVQERIKDVRLKYDSQNTTVFITRMIDSDYDHNGRLTLMSSTSYFENKSMTKILHSGAIEFEMINDVIFITQPKKSSYFANADGNAALDLLISVDGGNKFVFADFGSETQGEAFVVNDTMDYQIVDVDGDGQIMLAVFHANSFCNLYTSTLVTSYVAKFTLSLERVMGFHPMMAFSNTFLGGRVSSSFVDVYKIKGLRGIFIASQLKPGVYADNNTFIITPEDTLSVITFNQGATWSPLQGPDVDERGYQFEACKSIKTRSCSLHVSQQLSRRYPSTRNIPILSSASATGILLASGNMGPHLYQHLNVYVSADAGLSWHQVLKGSYYFVMGDHGGIIVAVKYYKSGTNTNRLLYSTNEGITWNSIIFYHHPLHIYGLLTEPGHTSTSFTLFGSKSTDVIDWVIISVDLAKVFHHNCTEDDYKNWSPADGTRGKRQQCILGRKEVFQRRMVNVECYNGQAFDRHIEVLNCECNRMDYQCDFGFKKDSNWTNECIRDDEFHHDPFQVPADCKEGHFYNRTRGYIKILGDSCQNGLASRFEPQHLACPLNMSEFLLIAQRTRIMQMDLSINSSLEHLPIEPKYTLNVISVEFDMKSNCIMWADSILDVIMQQCFDGEQNASVLVSKDLKSVEGLSFNWLTNTLYFVDGIKQSIELIKTDLKYAGGMRKLIMKNFNKPRGIVVHPKEGYIFYSDWSETNPFIGRANLDGSQPIVLFKRPLVHWPNGLCIDFFTDRLYWVDASKDFIASSHMDGSNFKKILSDLTQLRHPFSMAIHKEFMYWDDWTTKSLYYANKNSGQGLRIIQSDMPSAMGIKVFSTASERLIHATNSPCATSDENTCSYLCIPMPKNVEPKGYRCLCPDGTKISESVDGRSTCMCPNDLVALSNGTCRPLLNGTCSSEQFQCNNTLCVADSWVCNGMDDCGDGSDELNCESMNSLSNGVCQKYQFKCLSSGKCITSVWVCDYEADCEDGSDEVNCTGLPCKTNYFKCDNGQCILQRYRCDLDKDCVDGSDEKNCSLIQEICKSNEFQCDPLKSECLPRSWICDGEIDCSNGRDEDNCSRKVCPKSKHTCPNGKCIHKNWLCDGQPDCEDGSDEADVNCTDAGKRNKYKHQFSVPSFPQGNCSEWMFKCKNEQCIPQWWKCDRSEDCSDGSDEIECGVDESYEVLISTTQLSVVKHDNDSVLMTCGIDKFQCQSGRCIWSRWVCDGESDCPDSDDEVPSVCAARPKCDKDEEFHCIDSGKCLPFHKLCDGNDDCKDRSDESSCDRVPPSSLIHSSSYECVSFRCDDENCLDELKVCDGRIDCFDATDEKDCQQSHPYPNISVRDLTLDEASITSNGFVVHWWLPDDERYSEEANQIQFIPMYKMAYYENNVFKKLPVLSANASSFRYNNLQTFTRYNVSIAIKVGDVEHLPTKFLMVRTDSAPPTPPLYPHVRQIDDYLQFDWHRPTKPNGEITGYYVRVRPPSDGVLLYTQNNQTSMKVKLSFVAGIKYTLDVAAINRKYEGPYSLQAVIIFDKEAITEPVQTLAVKTLHSRYAVLSWQAPLLVNPSSAVNYRISYISNIRFTNYTDITVSHCCEVNITNLSPGTSYTFTVWPQRYGFNGPTSRISVTTKGKQLPRPIIKNVGLSPTSGTSVNLVWDIEEEKSIKWIYGIMYGPSESELILYGVRNTTEATNILLTNLHACESYVFVVRVIGPNGVGPISTPATQPTMYSPGAAPKRLRVRVDRNRAIITWISSCPIMENKIGYILQIRNLIKGTNSCTELSKVLNTTFRHEFNDLHFGVHYSVIVRTSVPGSAWTPPVYFDGPTIPPPIGLVHYVQENTRSQIVFWRTSPKLPVYMKNNSSFTIYLSKYQNFSDSVLFNVPHDPFVITEDHLEIGSVYYMAVAIIDAEGYSSPKSSSVTIESVVLTSQASSRGGFFGVNFFFIAGSILVIVLSGLTIVYYIRHKKHQIPSSLRSGVHLRGLASRYNCASGATRIMNQTSFLDDENDYQDTSPIIRGFSDQEPLVIH